MSTVHTLRVRIINNATGGMLAGYGGYVGFVAQGGAPGSVVPMTEDTGNPGVYFKTGVAGGYYDIYLDLDKSGSFLAGDLKLSGVRHGLAVDDVSDVNIEDYSIALVDLSPEVIAYIDAAAGSPPDGVTIGLNGSGELEVKDNGLDGSTKLIDESLPGAKLQDETLAERHHGADSIIAAHTKGSQFLDTAIFERAGIPPIWTVKDDALPGAKLVPESVTGGQLSDETLPARSFIPDSLEAGMTNPASFMNTDQFERVGTPYKWQIKQSLLDSISGTGAPYIVNVLDFGADTSGAGSSSQAFQDAFNAVGEGKGIVVIPPGTYLAKNLTVPGNVDIWAFGAIITMGGAAPAGETSPDSWIIKSVGSSGNENPFIRIEGGDWRGELTTVFTEQSSGNLFDFTFCKSVSITGAILRNSRKHAVSFARCFDCHVTHCRIDKVAGAGVSIAGSTDIFVSQNDITESAFGVKAITQVTDPQRIFVTTNRISVFTCGVSITFGSGSHVAENSIYYVAKSGFTVHLRGILVGYTPFGAPAGSMIENIMIYGNNVNGLFLYFSIVVNAGSLFLRNAMVANNNISGHAGITFDFDFGGEYQNVLIKGNLITCTGSGSTTGIAIYGQGTFGVQFNQVIGFNWGISVTNIAATSIGHLIANNRISEGTYGMALAKMASSIIRDNFFENTGDLAFYLTNTANNNYIDRNYLLNCAETYSDGGTGNQITNTVEM